MGVGVVSSSATEVTVTELLGELSNTLSNIHGRSIGLSGVVLGAEPEPPQLEEAAAAGMIGHLRALLMSARQIDERLERVVRAL